LSTIYPTTTKRTITFQLNSLNTKKPQKLARQMTLEIQGPSWDRNKYVAELYQLIGCQYLYWFFLSLLVFFICAGFSLHQKNYASLCYFFYLVYLRIGSKYHFICILSRSQERIVLLDKHIGIGLLFKVYFKKKNQHR
jgi:hypothetical protein